MAPRPGRGQRLQDRIRVQSGCETARLHPILRIVAAETAETLEAQHAALDANARRIARALAVIGQMAEGADRAGAARAAWLEIMAFLSDYSRHAAEEETEAMPALAAAFAPMALFAARDAIASSVPFGASLAGLPIIARSQPVPPALASVLGALDRNTPEFVGEVRRMLEMALGDDAARTAAPMRKAA